MTTVGANTEIDPSTRLANLEAAVFGGPNPAGGGAQVQDAVQYCTGSADAITLKAGIVVVNSTGVDAMVLNPPIAGAASAGGNDGSTLIFFMNTAHAHTITCGTSSSTPIQSGSTPTLGHVITFTAAIGNTATLKAVNGVWIITGNTNGTLS
jgi:hypothetical protein